MPTRAVRPFSMIRRSLLNVFRHDPVAFSGGGEYSSANMELTPRPSGSAGPETAAATTGLSKKSTNSDRGSAAWRAAPEGTDQIECFRRDDLPRSVGAIAVG
jgi:hypothetical protein